MSVFVPVVDALLHAGTLPTTVGKVFASLKKAYPEATDEAIKWAINRAVYNGYLRKVGESLFPIPRP